MKVQQFMSAAPVWCSPQDDVQALAKQMREHNIGFIPVLSDPDERKLVGVVTDRDVCLKVVAAGYDPHFTNVHEIMTHDVLFCEKGQSLAHAFALMQQSNVRRLPVVDAEEKMIGIISLDDIVRSQGVSAVPLARGIRRVLETSRRRARPVAVTRA